MYCRMFQGEHCALLSTFIKLPFVFKTFVLSIFECPFYKGFTVYVFRAETETKAKLEKVAEIKKINANMMSIKSEISKYEDTLKEYQMYRSFLENLTPPVSS